MISSYCYGRDDEIGIEATFKCDALGRRVEKKDRNNVITRFVYNGDKVIAETDASNNITAWYTPGICETRKDGFGNWQTHFYHTDALGSTRQLTDDMQRVADAYSYNAWGEEMGSLRPVSPTDTGKPENPYRFVGKSGYYTDDETGLVLLGARYYDPLTGRFITQDPIKDGLNWYAYADGNPVNMVDPSGLDAWTSFMGGLRALGGGIEAATGYTGAVASFTAAGATAGTGIGPVGFGALGVLSAGAGAHGVDTFQAGVRQMLTGEDVDSFTSVGLQAAGMSPFAANLTDTGIGVVGSFGAGMAHGFARAATIAATDPLAKGLSWTQTLSKWETGSTALNNADFAALGGPATSPLFKAPYIKAWVDTAGKPLTTTRLQGIGSSVKLIPTGLTPHAVMGVGAAGAGVNAYTGAARSRKGSWTEIFR